MISLTQEEWEPMLEEAMLRILEYWRTNPVDPKLLEVEDFTWGIDVNFSKD